MKYKILALFSCFILCLIADLLLLSIYLQWIYDNSDHISTEGGHAEHVLVTRISNKMDDSPTDKQIFEFSKCPSPVEFRAAIYIVKCFRLKGIARRS